MFDLDDTLYEYEPCDRAGAAAVRLFITDEVDVSPASFDRSWTRARASVKRRLGATGSSHSRLLYAHEALADLGLGSQPTLALAVEHEYWREYLLAARLRPGAVELLKALRYRGADIAIVTDLTLQIQLRKVVHLGIDRLVDHLVASEEASGDKSTLSPFQVLLERVGAARLDRVWFIGDSPPDVECALGLQAQGLLGVGVGWLLDRGAPSLGQHQEHRRWRQLAEITAALQAPVSLAAPTTAGSSLPTQARAVRVSS